MAVERIISGGQTGVDRAALDVALEFGIACGGWCPRGRLAEDGLISERYPLRETPQEDYAERTRWNVRDSDGTLILHRGPELIGGTALTRDEAQLLGRPLLCVDLAEPFDRETVAAWLRASRIRVVNVAGLRESTCPGIHLQALTFLRLLFESGPPAIWSTTKDRSAPLDPGPFSS